LASHSGRNVTKIAVSRKAPPDAVRKRAGIRPPVSVPLDGSTISGARAPALAATIQVVKKRRPLV